MTIASEEATFTGLCAIAHLDIGPRIPNAVELSEGLMGELCNRPDETPGSIDIVSLKKIGRGNHFELVQRYESEEAYLEHLDAPSYRAFRNGTAPANAAPYWDRLHRVRSGAGWPHASAGDYVVVAQIEIQPGQLEEGLAAYDRYVAAQAAWPDLGGQVSLQRIEPTFHVELLSVWPSPDSFDAFLASEEAKFARDELSPLLIAPIDDRRHWVIAGGWA